MRCTSRCAGGRSRHPGHRTTPIRRGLPCPQRWDARVLLGKSYLEAIAIIAAHKSTFQLQRLNGEYEFDIMDFETDRVDLVVSDGVVTHVALG